MEPSILAAALDATPSPRGSYRRTTIPAFSKVRFTANLRPDNATTYFDSGTLHTSSNKDLQAFSYSVGEVAPLAGFGATTTATARHTNLKNKRRLNDDGRMSIVGFAVTPDGYLKKPLTLTNANTIADDSDNVAAELVPDGVNGSWLFGFLLRLIADSYVPYVQFGSASTKEYLGRLAWLVPPGGIVSDKEAFLRGDPMISPEGWVWGEGTNTELVVGFELAHKTSNTEWVTDDDSPWIDVWTAMGMGAVITGAKVANTVVGTFANLDVMVSAHGGIKAPIGRGG